MKIKYWDESNNAKIHTISNVRNVKVGYFNDCTFDGVSMHYPQPLIKSKNELLLPTIEKFMSLGRGTIYEDDMVWECNNTNIKQVEDTPLFYFVYNCANYFHWIYDTVPYLYSYFELKKKTDNLKLLVSTPDGVDDLYPFIYETLSLLGITRDDLVFLNKNTEYKTLIVGSSLTHNRMSLAPPHNAVFSIINSMEGDVSEKYEKIYVSRRTWTQNKSENIGTDYTTQRMCMNEDEVVDMLKDYGFKEIFCENYSMAKKIGIFRSAKVVVGPIGGGMSNVLFCEPTTKVVSINSPEFFNVNERLLHAINHTKLHMFDDTRFVERKDDIITDKNALSISGGLNSTWKVDLNKLRSIISK